MRNTATKILSAGFGSILLFTPCFASQARPADDTSGQGSAAAVPAEELRMNTAAFREGLRKRGLTEILELHLRDFPPATAAASLLLMRELKLTEFADRSRPKDQRLASIVEADRLLEQLLTIAPNDSRRFDWKFLLAHSLLYNEAESAATSILYTGGSAQDRRELTASAFRARTLTEELLRQLAEEGERIDALSVAEFEKLDGARYLEELDRIHAQAEYLLPWALFFDALPRADSDPQRAELLNGVMRRFGEKPQLLKTSHDISKVQLQAQLLAGMTFRRLSDFASARGHFERAISIGERIDDAERIRLGWAIRLAWMERIRNESDDGRFDEAVQALSMWRKLVESESAGEMGDRLVSALLERSVVLARAASFERAGKADVSRKMRDAAWLPIARLAAVNDRARDEVYATLYHLIGKEADESRLDPVDYAAFVAGMLRDADQAKEGADEAYERVARVSDRFSSVAGKHASASSDGGAIAPVEQEIAERMRTLAAEIAYNAAFAEFRRGDHEAAAARFLTLAEKYPSSNHAASSASFAVQLAAQLFEDAANENPTSLSLYRRALETLLERFGQGDAARYWRFYYAQLLEEQGEFDRAAAQYAFVDADHEHHMWSVFLRIRCMALGLNRFASEHPDDLLGLRRRRDDFLTLQRDFVTRAVGAMGRGEEGDSRRSIRSLLAETRLLVAETNLLPGVNLPAQAIEALHGYEKDFPEERALAARLWRVRLLAHEKLDHGEEAERALLAFFAVDPSEAVSEIQSLYQSTCDEHDRLAESGDARAAAKKAETALLLARHLFRWSEADGNRVSLADRRTLSVQLAEALLRAGKFNEAKAAFASCRSSGPGESSKKESPDARVEFGFAECLYSLGDHAAALPIFNRLVSGLPKTDGLHWRSLLRDLQCRTALQHPPDGIINVIRQQRYFHPDLGGSRLAPRFEQLLRENERRKED